MPRPKSSQSKIEQLNSAAPLKKVNNSVRLHTYYRGARMLLDQATCYKQAKVNTQAYVMFLRFATLVLETIKQHPDLQPSDQVYLDLKKQVPAVLGELERLKLELSLEEIEDAKKANRPVVSSPIQPPQEVNPGREPAEQMSMATRPSVPVQRLSDADITFLTEGPGSGTSAIPTPAQQKGQVFRSASVPSAAASPATAQQPPVTISKYLQSRSYPAVSTAALQSGRHDLFTASSSATAVSSSSNSRPSGYLLRQAGGATSLPRASHASVAGNSADAAGAYPLLDVSNMSPLPKVELSAVESTVPSSFVQQYPAAAPPPVGEPQQGARQGSPYPGYDSSLPPPPSWMPSGGNPLLQDTHASDGRAVPESPHGYAAPGQGTSIPGSHPLHGIFDPFALPSNGDASSSGYPLPPPDFPPPYPGLELLYPGSTPVGDPATFLHDGGGSAAPPNSYPPHQPFQPPQLVEDLLSTCIVPHPSAGPALAPQPLEVHYIDPSQARADGSCSSNACVPYAPGVPSEPPAGPAVGGPAEISSRSLDGRLRSVHISLGLLEEFLALARSNTRLNVESCGILAGKLIPEANCFEITTLIIPKQKGTSDTVQALNEEEIFEAQFDRSLYPLGWIHTHPSQTCFLSSVDVHTQCGYQTLLEEAVAIVMAPSDRRRSRGIFRLSSPDGLKLVQQCMRSGFHPHALEADDLYRETDHVVYLSEQTAPEVIDLR